MDACMNCPFYEDCILDPKYPCFLDQSDGSEFVDGIVQRIMKSDE